VRFHQSSYSVNEDDRSVQPVLVLSSPAATNITVAVTSADISATGKDTYHNYARPQGIMPQILLIMLFQISSKIPNYAHYYSFYAPHCYYYSIKFYQ